ncbi:hypothetical protein RIF29_13027 [Crotalaria pallida]|uniref:Uncharacterized protein n=1 Tax=Crotalaria pallida TaxID=3830 RepID=A0AAN9IP32_CROPI
MSDSNQPPPTSVSSPMQMPVPMVTDSTDHFRGNPVVQGNVVVDSSSVNEAAAQDVTVLNHMAEAAAEQEPIRAIPVSSYRPYNTVNNNNNGGPRKRGRPRKYGPTTTTPVGPIPSHVPIAPSPPLPTSTAPPPPAPLFPYLAPYATHSSAAPTVPTTPVVTSAPTPLTVAATPLLFDHVVPSCLHLIFLGH